MSMKFNFLTPRIVSRQPEIVKGFPSETLVDPGDEKVHQEDGVADAIAPVAEASREEREQADPPREDHESPEAQGAG